MLQGYSSNLSQSSVERIKCATITIGTLISLSNLKLSTRTLYWKYQLNKNTVRDWMIHMNRAEYKFTRTSLPLLMSPKWDTY